jgi:phosphoribosylcarboxyaminoimidazole (NCAIR) mutase|tara:strand:- start:1447 stop:1617 length:171 start_codon:yes stop_codon:yes gene_type:complete
MAVPDDAFVGAGMLWSSSADPTHVPVTPHAIAEITNAHAAIDFILTTQRSQFAEKM